MRSQVVLQVRMWNFKGGPRSFSRGQKEPSDSRGTLRGPGTLQQPCRLQRKVQVGVAPGKVGSPGGPEDQSLPRVLECQGGLDSPCGPSGVGSLDNQSGPSTANVQGVPGANNQGVLVGPGVEETVGSAVTNVSTVAWAAHASGPSRDAALVTV